MAAQILVARTREEMRDVHPAAVGVIGLAVVLGLMPAVVVLLAGSLLQAAVFGQLVASVAGIDHGSSDWRQPVEPDSLIIGEELPRTWLWPVVGRMTTHYGGCTAAMCPHWGIDIAAQLGTLVQAAADGVITRIGWDPDGYGHFIVLDHGSGWQTLYAHLQPGTSSGYGMTIGMAVHRGDAIGGLGSSGASTGPHLHFEVRHDGGYINPTRILGA
ncbi:MAG: M23 family metallopeptidase [Chloroflexi bacterium]|nr:M23 family metallopeptidase [Chloroflexota bacterium]